MTDRGGIGSGGEEVMVPIVINNKEITVYNVNLPIETCRMVSKLYI